MIIRFAHTFRKSLAKLTTAQKRRVAQTIRVFRNNPFAQSLRNHALKGDMQGLRAFSVAFDLRIVYREEGDHAIVLLLRVGSHAKVY